MGRLVESIVHRARSPIHSADAFTRYTTDGILAIDNDPAENALRRAALGRKNWLFAGSDTAGRTAATLFSLAWEPAHTTALVSAVCDDDRESTAGQESRL